jgi:PPOX class probable F420-dependent enzyme
LKKGCETLDLETKLKKFDEMNVVATLATILPNGDPHLAPVWFNIENGLIQINTPAGNQKDKNLQRHSRVAINVLDPSNFFNQLSLRGEVVERNQEIAEDHIETLAQKYTGAPYTGPGKGNRVTYRIKPIKAIGVYRPR